jgi:hypothetical protein
MGRSSKNEPGAFYEATTVKTAGSARDPAVYEAFLSACRPVGGHALEWLTKDKGVAPDVITQLGLRLCGSEYPDIMRDLGVHFGEAALLVAGLLKHRGQGSSPIPSFLHYDALKAAFLVIPYIEDGRPVYLKARPPISKDEAERGAWSAS